MRNLAGFAAIVGMQRGGATMVVRNRYTVPGISRTGRPLAEAEWIAQREAETGRALAPRRPGRKKGAKDEK